MRRRAARSPVGNPSRPITPAMRPMTWVRFWSTACDVVMSLLPQEWEVLLAVQGSPEGALGLHAGAVGAPLALGQRLLDVAQHTERVIPQAPGPVLQHRFFVEGFGDGPEPGEVVCRPQGFEAPCGTAPPRLDGVAVELELVRRTLEVRKNGGAQ